MRGQKWLDQEMRWPMGQQEVALISVPLLLIALPLAAREVVLPTKPLLWGYGAVALFLALGWVVLCIGSIARAKEAFYRKYEQPLLSKEYQDG